MAQINPSGDGQQGLGTPFSTGFNTIPDGKLSDGELTRMQGKNELHTYPYLLVLVGPLFAKKLLDCKLSGDLLRQLLPADLQELFPHSDTVQAPVNYILRTKLADIIQRMKNLAVQRSPHGPYVMNEEDFNIRILKSLGETALTKYLQSCLSYEAVQIIADSKMDGAQFAKLTRAELTNVWFRGDEMFWVRHVADRIITLAKQLLPPVGGMSPSKSSGSEGYNKRSILRRMDVDDEVPGPAPRSLSAPPAPTRITVFPALPPPTLATAVSLLAPGPVPLAIKGPLQAIGLAVGPAAGLGQLASTGKPPVGGPAAWRCRNRMGPYIKNKAHSKQKK